jgi:hypothetical protein
MPLSPADFYAYSRATGTTFPEDPEERAQLAPEVLAFRRNQLKAPQQEEQQGFNLTNALGIGAALAGLGAGAYGIRRALGSRPERTQPTLPIPQGKGVDIGSPQNLVRDLGAATNVEPETQRVAREAVSSTPPPSQKPPVVKQETPATEPLTFAKKYLQITGAVEPKDLTDIQKNQHTFVVQQQIEAADPGLDQIIDKNVVIPKQRDVTAFESFSQRADQISSEAQAQRAALDALNAQRSKAPKNARMLQTLGPSNGLTQDEIFHRISASANDYRVGSMEPLTELDIAALLDPTVPTEAVKDLLGTTLAVRGGRVGRNLDYEVQAEGAGMTERGSTVEIVGGEQGSDVLAYNPRTGQFDIDTSVDLEDMNLIGGRTSDYDNNAADYGDVEGPGGFVSTKGFKERTKSGSSIIPGQVTETAGILRGSERQEREIDRVLPARETLEGDPASGWAFDEEGRPRLVGTGTRLKETRTNLAGNPIRVVSATGRRREPGAYQGKITVDDPSYDPTSGGYLHGRVQPATNEPSPFVSTEPVTDYMSAKERLISDDKGNWYINQAKTKVVGEKQLRGYVGADTNLRDLSLDRNELVAVLNNGAELWDAKGGGSPLDRQTFLIQHLDGYLKTQKQIKLPLLQPNKEDRISPAAFTFINNIQPGSKESSIYVKPAHTNEEGRPLVNRKTYSSGKIVEEPIVASGYADMEAVPLPGHYKISGAGGVDVREIDESIEDQARTYFSPLLETASQRKVMALGQSTGVPADELIGATTTPVGQELSALRSELETKPVGYKVKSPGSFARTQNPYTGAAAAAMGPAARVASGNYQYPERQLGFALEPTSQRQLDERNLFVLAANLTPGGRVVRGGLQLNTGLGAIPAGVGALSESQTISRYGVSGSQLQQVGNQLMAQAAYKRGQQPGPTSATSAPAQGPATPPMQAPAPAPMAREVPSSTEMAGYARRNAPIPETAPMEQARADAIARHIGNYISAASERIEGPASIQGVKLKGVGQNALRPYQTPSEGMIQQLMRAARRR